MMIFKKSIIMQNIRSKEEKIKKKNQDSIASELEEKHTEHPEKNIISIKDVINKHPSSSNTHALPLDEQQYDAHPQSKNEDE
jgi:hypothetical protein